MRAGTVPFLRSSQARTVDPAESFFIETGPLGVRIDVSPEKQQLVLVVHTPLRHTPLVMQPESSHGSFKSEQSEFCVQAQGVGQDPPQPQVHGPAHPPVQQEPQSQLAPRSPDAQPVEQQLLPPSAPHDGRHVPVGPDVE